jgi:hypothetical protein
MLLSGVCLILYIISTYQYVIRIHKCDWLYMETYRIELFKNIIQCQNTELGQLFQINLNYGLNLF